MNTMRPWGSAIGPKRKTLHAPASRGLLTLLLFGAPAIFSACGDDGNVAGAGGNAGQATSGNANSSGHANGGNANSSGHANGGNANSAGHANGGNANSSGGAGGSGEAGSAHAGAAPNGGTGSGGLNNSGGKAGGGASGCEISECLRANVCLDQCGGKVVSSGCCACGEGTVDELSCSTAGGQGGGGSGGSGSTCAGQTCASGQACVGYRTVGGAITAPDADGKCMATKHLEDSRCQNDFAYTCAELSGCSAPAATCHCAASAACANTNVCRLPIDAAWLDKAAVLVCELQAP